MNIPTNVLALVFVLSFLIVFHEGGHFAVAKFFKFPVEIFSLGFGKRLFGWKRKETDYRVSLIPLGGYVKVVGLGPDESDIVAGTADAAPAQPGTRLQRLLILFAGPGVNLVLAFLLTAFAFLVGVEVAAYKSETPVVKVVDHGSPAEKAGIKEGDRIETISGKPVKTWEEVEIETGLAPREKLAVGIVRDGAPLTLDLTPEPRTKYDIGYTGLNPAILAVVARVVPNYPGAKAGLRVGDRIVSVNGKPVVLYFEVVRFIREAASGFDKDGAKPIEMVVTRGSETITLNVVPVKEGENWRIGFAPKEETIGPAPRARRGVRGLVARERPPGAGDRSDRRPPVPRDGLHAAAFGPDRHREVLRRGGALGRGPARHADGRPLAAARPPEPSADPAPRRRADLRHASRGRGAARLLDQGQGAPPAGRLRRSSSS